MTRRLWLVFFSGKIDRGACWSPLLHLLPDGFRHVSAASFYADTNRWVFLMPAASGTVIEVAEPDAGGPRLQEMFADASAVLRIPSRHERAAATMGFWCVGAVKSVIGIRSGALLPRTLFRDLLRHGAEQVEIAHGEVLQAGPTAGRPGSGLAPGG